MLLKRKIEVVFAIALVLFLSFISPLPTANSAGFTLSSSARTETTITLTWTQSTDLYFYSYTLYYSSAGTNGPFTQIWSTSNLTQTSINVDGLSPNTDYWFYVADSGFTQNYNSNTYQVSTTSRPQLTITAQTATTASFSWIDYNSYSSLVPFQSYTVQMSTSGSSGPWSTLTTITNQAQTTYVITGLSAGLYYVRMYDSVGSHNYVSYSNTVPVYILSVSISATSITTITLGQQVQFSASPEGGSGSYNYQWYSNGAPISTSSNFAFNPSQAGSYNINLVITDSSYPTATATSNSIPVTVNDLSTSPDIPEISTPYIAIIIVVMATVGGAIIVRRKSSEKQRPT
jgi:hypothetical protein